MGAELLQGLGQPCAESEGPDELLSSRQAVGVIVV